MKLRGRGSKARARKGVAVRTFGELIDVTQKNDERRIKAQAQAANAALGLLQPLAAIGLLIGLGAAYFVVRALNRPLARLQGTIEKVARGDETARARLEGESSEGRRGQDVRRADRRHPKERRAAD